MAKPSKSEQVPGTLYSNETEKEWDLNTKISFHLVPNLAVDILPGESFIDRFIHDIFHAEWKVEP